jgi:acyl-CoA synthetase (AMP-forming)/AMP-acid ligase II
MTRITVGDIIAEHRRSYPGRLALADGEYHLTWPELDERVNRLANALRAVGVGQGDRILWLGQNSFRVYELLGAAAKIGAMVCPGYWRWAPPEMAFAIEDFSPKVVIWQDEEIGSTVRAARAASPVAESALWLRHDGDPGHGYEAFLAAATRPTLAWTSTRIRRCWSSTPPRSAAGSAAQCCRTPT